MKLRSRKEAVFLIFAVIFIVFSCVIIFTYRNTGEQSLQWALPQNYMFAVGVNDFDGDVLPNGTYSFYQSAVKSGTSPVVWDIYTSQKLYTHFDELNEEEYKGSIGGYEDQTLYGSIENKYVYVIYNGVLSSTGILNINVEPFS